MMGTIFSIKRLSISFFHPYRSLAGKANAYFSEYEILMVFATEEIAVFFAMKKSASS